MKAAAEEAVSRQNLHPTGAEVEYDAFDDIAFVIGAIGDAQRDLA